jgi:histone H3/H4
MDSKTNTVDAPFPAPRRVDAPARGVAGARKRKMKPGRKALMEIRSIQKKSGDKHVIPREPLNRLAREILQDINPEMRITSNAINALREMTEAEITQLFAISGGLAGLSKRATVEWDHFRVAANLSNGRFSTAGLTGGSLLTPFS